MNGEEAALFAMTMAALADSDNGAETSLIENAEPTTATCTVERS